MVKEDLSKEVAFWKMLERCKSMRGGKDIIDNEMQVKHTHTHTHPNKTSGGKELGVLEE